MMDGAAFYSWVLIVTVYGVLLAGTVRGLRNREQMVGTLLAQPGARAAFFRNSIVNLAILVAITALIVALNPDLTAPAAGWTWPDGDGPDYLLAALALLMVIAVYVRSRRGPLPAATEAMLPRTTGERWLAGGVSIAFGVGEEVIYRGLFLAIGTELLGLPVLVVAVAGLVLFIAAHAYQDWRGMMSVGLLGVIFTGLYLTSASLLFPIVVHTCWDAMVLLLLRPKPEAVPAPVPSPRPAADPARPLADPSQPVVDPAPPFVDPASSAADSVLPAADRALPVGGGIRLRTATPSDSGHRVY